MLSHEFSSIKNSALSRSYQNLQDQSVVFRRTLYCFPNSEKRRRKNNHIHIDHVRQYTHHLYMYMPIRNRQMNYAWKTSGLISLDIDQGEKRRKENRLSTTCQYQALRFTAWLLRHRRREHHPQDWSKRYICRCNGIFPRIHPWTIRRCYSLDNGWGQGRSDWSKHEWGYRTVQEREQQTKEKSEKSVMDGEWEKQTAVRSSANGLLQTSTWPSN